MAYNIYDHVVISKRWFGEPDSEALTLRVRASFSDARGHAKARVAPREDGKWDAWYDGVPQRPFHSKECAMECCEIDAQRIAKSRLNLW